MRFTIQRLFQNICWNKKKEAKINILPYKF
jgi:hypothetical protein